MILSKIFCFPKKNFNVQVAKYLKKKFSSCKNIVITGGKTVKPIYKIIDKSTFYNKNFFLSDERLVPYSSNLSNYKSLINYNFVKKNNFIHFNIGKKFSKNASKKYFETLSKVKALELVILSLGKNSHIASIFFNKYTKNNQIYFFNKYKRISISLKILSKSENIIIICNKKSRAAELAKNIKSKKRGFEFFNSKKIIFIFKEDSCQSFFKNIY